MPSDRGEERRLGFGPVSDPTSPADDGNDRHVASLRDVAGRAGVSVSTASRVLSGSTHPVSDATRQRVLAAADELGFAPNRLARALATARSQTIGVVVHDVSDPYFAGIVRGLEDVAGTRDHALFVSSSDRDMDKEMAVLTAFVANQVDAIVLAASGLAIPEYVAAMSTILARFESLGGVVVTLSEHSYQSARVVFDNRGATALIVDHLVELGHHRIAYVAGPDELNVTAVRLEGYRQGLEAAGLDYDDDLVISGNFSLQGGGEAATRLVERGATAILAANDMMAIGALRSLLDQGISVPDDISVAGYDDIEFAAYAPVPLTTVRIPLTEYGRLGARLVLDLLSGQVPDEPPEVHPELIVRASTGPIPEG